MLRRLFGSNSMSVARRRVDAASVTTTSIVARRRKHTRQLVMAGVVLSAVALHLYAGREEARDGPKQRASGHVGGGDSDGARDVEKERARSRRPFRQQAVLALDLSSPPPEVDQPSLFNLRPTLSMRDTIRALDLATQDERVVGVLASVGENNSYSLAQAEEVRAAIKRMRAAGKATHVYAPHFGAFNPGNTAYYLATAFEHIHLQPCGDVLLSGFDVHEPFIKSMLHWIGVEPQFIQRKEYKNAPNMFLEDGYTDAHRTSTTSILTSMYNVVIDAIVEARKLTRQRVIELIDTSPMSALAAKNANLVDTLAFENDIASEVKRTSNVAAARVHSIGDGDSGSSHTIVNSLSSRFITDDLTELGFPLGKKENVRLERFNKYAQHAIYIQNQKEKRLRIKGASQIALIYGVGEVTSNYSMRDGANQFSAPLLAKALHKAANDPSVKAIVFRINSPGGSSSASEAIYYALLEAKAHGKKVIVSMGSLAASGGYYVAAPADYVFANHSTLTGSIGVFGGKFAFRDLLQKRLHVSLDRIKVGDDVGSGLSSFVDPWTSEQKERMEVMIDRVYANFVTVVASGRGMDIKRAESLAHGRVWMGHEAKECGLVDEIGGLYEAVTKAKEMVNEPNAVVSIFPKHRSILWRLVKTIGMPDAEWDDEPIFNAGPSQSRVGALFQYLLSECTREAVQLIGINIRKEVSDVLRFNVDAPCQASLNAMHGDLGSVVDVEGKLRQR